VTEVFKSSNSFSAKRPATFPSYPSSRMCAAVEDLRSALAQFAEIATNLRR
jgi:hypothetical protein